MWQTNSVACELKKRLVIGLKKNRELRYALHQLPTCPGHQGQSFQWKRWLSKFSMISLVTSPVFYFYNGICITTHTWHNIRLDFQFQNYCVKRSSWELNNVTEGVNLNRGKKTKRCRRPKPTTSWRASESTGWILGMQTQVRAWQSIKVQCVNFWRLNRQ